MDESLRNRRWADWLLSWKSVSGCCSSMYLRMCLVPWLFNRLRHPLWEILEGSEQGFIGPPRPTFLQVQGYFQIPQNSLDLFWASHSSFTLLCRISQLSTNAVGIGNSGSWSVISVPHGHIKTITSTSRLRQPLTKGLLLVLRRLIEILHCSVHQLLPLFGCH